ncbi:MAG: O-antigen ligase family protein [Bacteroidota bacterium]
MNRSIDKLESGAFAFLGTATIVSVLAAFKTELYYLALIPFGLMIAYLAVVNFKLLYFFLLTTIPFSIEYSFSGSLGTDLPDEPLMIGLMFVTIIFVFTNYKSLPTGFFGNLLIVLLCIHLFWIFISAVSSVNVLVSLKHFLAKTWYVTTFCLLTAILIKTKDDLKAAFWCVFIPMTVMIIQVIIRHGLKNFSFDEINEPMMPFFRNHVNYAAIVSIVFPLILLARTWYGKGTFKRRVLNFSVLLYIVAIYLSYTRTCYIALLMLLPVYFVIRFKMMKPAVLIAAIGAIICIGYLFTNNNYLKYAPEFEETIIHDEFGQHLSSTFEGKDVSSMERVYRWVAATRMFKAHPWMGFGPGNFYPHYKSYTLASFETYVSDNPERSSTHNYALMLLTEQGTIGLSIFILLTVVIFAYGERIYHQAKGVQNKRIVMALLLMLTMVFVNLTLSDMLESDKVGPFFFIGIALLATMDIRNRSLEAKGE